MFVISKPPLKRQVGYVKCCFKAIHRYPPTQEDRYQVENCPFFPIKSWEAVLFIRP